METQSLLVGWFIWQTGWRMSSGNHGEDWKFKSVMQLFNCFQLTLLQSVKRPKMSSTVHRFCGTSCKWYLKNVRTTWIQINCARKCAFGNDSVWLWLHTGPIHFTLEDIWPQDAVRSSTAVKKIPRTVWTDHIVAQWRRQTRLGKSLIHKTKPSDPVAEESSSQNIWLH